MKLKRWSHDALKGAAITCSQNPHISLITCASNKKYATSLSFLCYENIVCLSAAPIRQAPLTQQQAPDNKIKQSFGSFKPVWSAGREQSASLTCTNDCKAWAKALNEKSTVRMYPGARSSTHLVVASLTTTSNHNQSPILLCLYSYNCVYLKGSQVKVVLN